MKQKKYLKLRQQERNKKVMLQDIKEIVFTKEDIQKATLSVVVVCGIFVIAMALLDLGFSNLYQAIFK